MQIDSVVEKALEQLSGNTKPKVAEIQKAAQWAFFELQGRDPTREELGSLVGGLKRAM